MSLGVLLGRDHVELGRIAAIDQLSFALGMSLAALAGAGAVEITGDPRASAWIGVGIGLGLYGLLRAFCGQSEDQSTQKRQNWLAVATDIPTK